MEIPTSRPTAAPPAMHSLAPLAAAGRESLRHYGAMLAHAAVWFGLLSAYLLYRRGYYDLYVANKALAGTAAILFGILLLLGPLGKYFTAFDRYLMYRKELGMVGAAIAIAHAVVSYVFLPEHFPAARFFTSGKIPFAFGLVATVLVIALVAISNRPMLQALGGTRWWWAQRWGVRLMFVAVALHVGIMKWPGWMQWYQQGGGLPSAALKNPWLPGAGLLVGWFMGFVLLVRLADFAHPRLGKLAWYASAVSFPVAVVLTFWWGRRFAMP